MKSNKIFTSKDDILKYMQISNRLFEHFLKIGLPAVQINTRWYAHADNLDDWFRKNTKKQGSITIPE